MSREDTLNDVCFHCGNKTPLTHIAAYQGMELFEHIDNHRYSEDFEYRLYQCSTCSGITIFGDFLAYPKARDTAYKRIYPQGSRLIPEGHKVASKDCVPSELVCLYEQNWPLRHISPDAFAVQIRKALEYICKEQGAVGDSLISKLSNMSEKQTFPGHFAEMTDLIRKIGNLGAHAGERKIDFWDAELLDEFFRAVVEYVYITPSRIQRMRQRIEHES